MQKVSFTGFIAYIFQENNNLYLILIKICDKINTLKYYTPYAI